MAANYLFQQFGNEMMEVIREADVVFSNKDEAMEFGRGFWEELGLQKDTLDLKDICAAVGQMGNGGKIVVITDSANDVVVGYQGEVFLVPAVKVEES